MWCLVCRVVTMVVVVVVVVVGVHANVQIGCLVNLLLMHEGEWGE